MKKISLKNVLSSLTKEEMKKIMAGSGDGGLYCGTCTSRSGPCTSMAGGCVCLSSGGIDCI